MSSEDNLMYGSVFPNARQCTATSKRTGLRCRAPACTGYNVCRFHGAKGGQKTGQDNSQYSHGFYTKAAIAERQEFNRLVHDLEMQASFLVGMRD
jgi:hypothetical protein